MGFINKLVEYFTVHPFLLMGIFMIGLVGMLYSVRQLNRIKAAKEIVETQYDLAPEGILEQGYDAFSGEELQRFKTIVIRMRAQYGHKNIKVGHIAWMFQIIRDSSVDVDTVSIPAFIKEPEH